MTGSTEPRPHWHYLAALLLLCALVYGHTLDVPMYLDDISSISDNQAIEDLTDLDRIWQFSGVRFVVYLSFAVNYAVHGSEVGGYHLVNILIHLLTAVTLYGFLLALARTPALAEGSGERQMPLYAFAVAAIFLVHPLHTQAVTYIVQRSASLVALFYLLSLLSYVHGRLALGARRWLWFVLSATSAGLALFTKQNAATLPAAILLAEWCFLSRGAERRLAIQFLALVASGLALIVLLHTSGMVTLQELDSLTRETLRIDRLQYLASQMLVIWRYMGLFFWPDPLVLDYGLKPVWSFSDWQVWLAMLGHLSLITGAFALVRRAPLAAFGILFYYLAHGVESGIIPIKDLMFEHRSYLPDAGLCIALVPVLQRIKLQAGIAGVAALVLVFGMLAWQRNALWRDQIAFYNDAIRHAPDQSRNWIHLSKVNYKAGRYQDALDFMRRELESNKARNGVLRLPVEEYIYWAKLLRAAGEDVDAERVESYIASLQMSLPERARLELNKGNTFLQAGDYANAAAAYLEVLSIDPLHENAQVNLGVIALLEGRHEEAIAVFERFPANPVAASNLPLARQALAGEVEIGGVNEKVIEKSR